MVSYLLHPLDCGKRATRWWGVNELLVRDVQESVRRPLVPPKALEALR